MLMYYTNYTTVWETTCWPSFVTKSVHQPGQPARQSPPTMCWSSDGWVWFRIHFLYISTYTYISLYFYCIVSQFLFKKASFQSASWLHKESMEQTFVSARNWEKMWGRHKDFDECNFQQVFRVLIKMSSNPFYFDLSCWQNGLMTVPSITLRMLANQCKSLDSEIVRKDGVQCRLEIG